jgi:putative DNA primase/helicase
MKPQAFGQFKPDERVCLSAEDEEGAKYISAKGQYDAIALRHPDKDYWQRIIDDPSHPIELDEGTKKAGLLLTLDFAAIALCGVTMGLKKGGKHLVKNLEILAVQGRPVRIVFDSDLTTNTDIQRALKALATVLKNKGCVVSVAIIPLELKAKGIDDVWAKHGPEMVKKIMADALPYSQWLKGLEVQMREESERTKAESNEKASTKPPSPRKTAAEIAEQYKSSWKFDDEQKTWRIWNGKCWQKTGIGAFTSLLKTTLDAKNIDYTGIEYIENTRKLLECDLRQVHWQTWDKTRYISFSNRVFDGVKGKTLPHSPGMGFTSHLPYDYKPLRGDASNPLEALAANCPKINKFMRMAMQDDDRKVFKLIAITNALIKFRFHSLQMFVHLVGAPGSGKGTLARLWEKVVGRDNFKGCQLDRLSDGSTKASVVDKQLVVFADERKPVGIDSILSFTGGDAVSYRELHTPAADAFFYGLFLICSNKPIFVGDTTGLERRLCLVDFAKPIPIEKHDHSIEADFEAEIPALIAIALSLPDVAVTQSIRGIGAERIAEFKAKEWEMKVESNSVAAFLDENLVFDSTAVSPTRELYTAYKNFCEDGGLKALSIVKFPKYLATLIADEGLVATWVKERISTFEGLRLRKNTDKQPTHSHVLSGFAPVDTPICTSCAPVDAPVEPLCDKGLHQLHQLEGNISLENQLLSNEDETNHETLKENNPPQLVQTGADALPVSDTTGAVTGAQLVQSTPSTGAKPPKRTFDVGDRVVIKDIGGRYHGIRGVISEVRPYPTHTGLLVKFDKEVSFVQQHEFLAGDLMHLPQK